MVSEGKVFPSITGGLPLLTAFAYVLGVHFVRKAIEEENRQGKTPSAPSDQWRAGRQGGRAGTHDTTQRG